MLCPYARVAWTSTTTWSGVGRPWRPARGLRQAATSPTRGARCAGLRLVGRGTGTAAGSSTPWVGQAGGGSAHPAADCPAATAQRGAGRQCVGALLVVAV